MVVNECHCDDGRGGHIHLYIRQNADETSVNKIYQEFTIQINRYAYNTDEHMTDQGNWKCFTENKIDIKGERGSRV
jgi:hypothetical protein